MQNDLGTTERLSEKEAHSQTAAMPRLRSGRAKTPFLLVKGAENLETGLQE